MDITPKVVLASGSPRRRELLRSLFAEFTVQVPNVDEALLESEPLTLATERLAMKKARALTDLESLIIAADTLVGIDRKTLGKPSNPEDARNMLEELSGLTHQVVTGVAIKYRDSEVVFSETTHVTFREIGALEIAEYVKTGEPMDKAGSYAIQGGAAPFVERIEGSLSNVIGLPLERLSQELQSVICVAGADVLGHPRR